MEQKQDLFNYYKNALSNGLCNDYKARWRACHNDKEALVKLVMSQQSIPHFINYCYSGLGLSKEYILETFSDFINGNKVIEDADGVKGYAYSMFVGYSGTLEVKTDVTCFMWSTDTRCTIPQTKCPIIYCGCGSRIHLSLNGYNSPIIYLFDDSGLYIENGDKDSRVTIYKYSDKAKAETGNYCFADVRIFDKELRL